MRLPENERKLWACLTTVMGIAKDGGYHQTLDRLEAACKTFRVPMDHFDGLAKKFGYWYDRSTDAYVDKETWVMLNRNYH